MSFKPLKPDEIARRIRNKRIDAGLTVNDLARRIGISKGAMSQWEGGGGGVKSYKAEHFLQISRVLKVSPYWLMYGEEQHAGDVSENIAEYSPGLSPRAQQVIDDITILAGQTLSDRDMNFLFSAASHIGQLQRQK
jgi:transcriptional regulator with XRE-family HTH domain